jgi:hypothetical protein
MVLSTRMFHWGSILGSSTVNDLHHSLLRRRRWFVVRLLKLHYHCASCVNTTPYVSITHIDCCVMVELRTISSCKLSVIRRALCFPILVILQPVLGIEPSTRQLRAAPGMDRTHQECDEFLWLDSKGSWMSSWMLTVQYGIYSLFAFSLNTVRPLTEQRGARRSFQTLRCRW